jgi:hypothetical protein
VDDVTALATDKDELAGVGVETEEFCAGVVEVSIVEENPVTATETDLDERVTAGGVDEEWAKMDAEVEVDAEVVDAVGVEEDVKDWMIEEVDDDVVAASEVGVELELGVEIELDVGEVELDDAEVGEAEGGKAEEGDAVELAC